MALLVSRVSALLQEESEEPSMAKKCLSCDRAFNKLSFKELELAQQVGRPLDLIDRTVSPMTVLDDTPRSCEGFT